MDNLIVVGSTAYLYSYVQRNGVTPLVAFGLFTIILPYVAQKLLLAPPLNGRPSSISLPGPGGQMRDPVLPNFIDLYVQMLDQLLSQQRAQYERIRERIPELRRRAPRPYPDVSDSD